MDAQNRFIFDRYHTMYDNLIRQGGLTRLTRTLRPWEYNQYPVSDEDPETDSEYEWVSDYDSETPDHP
jgi:hypothetical protein